VKRILAIAALALVALGTTQVGAQTFQSGPARVGLLELYTSEGCSSCPPAESWLSGLAGNDALWKDVVPVAFHVDYWDYLGWRDVFASSAFSERQRDYASVELTDLHARSAERNRMARLARSRLFPAATGNAGTLARAGADGRTVRFAPAARSRLAHVVLLGMV
jgi:hypothetical protein